jgi:hypothetical protein
MEPSVDLPVCQSRHWLSYLTLTRVFISNIYLTRAMFIGTTDYATALLLLLWLYSPLFNLGRVFSFLILYAVGRTPCTGDQPVARPLSTHRTTLTQNKRTQTFMPWVGFEPTIPAFERAKTVHALDCAATVIGIPLYASVYVLAVFVWWITVGLLFKGN